MKTLVLENKGMEEVKEWFASQNYDENEVEVGYKGYYAEDCQDADFYEVEETENGYNVYSC